VNHRPLALDGADMMFHSTRFVWSDPGVLLPATDIRGKCRRLDSRRDQQSTDYSKGFFSPFGFEFFLPTLPAGTLKVDRSVAHPARASAAIGTQSNRRVLFGLEKRTSERRARERLPAIKRQIEQGTFCLEEEFLDYRRSRDDRRSDRSRKHQLSQA